MVTLCWYNWFYKENTFCGKNKLNVHNHLIA